MEDWGAVLDEMERRLAEADAEMVGGYLRFDPVPIPASLGPMPAECRERAEALYIATVEMQGRVSAAMAAIACQISRRSLVTDTRPAPAYVDQAM